MKYRKLGNSGAVVSEFALGTMTFGSEADEDTSFALMDDYFAAGGNFLDTADVYSAGVSEEIIGRWLKARPTEARQAVVATKGRFPMGQGPNDLGLSRRHLDDALNASLKRLDVERIDLYQMHAWDALTPIEETLRFLDDAVSAGKIGYYGFSNYIGWQISKAVYTAKMLGYSAPVTLQPHYNLLVRDIEHEIVPACEDAKMGLLPWSPLGGGWLTGKYKRDTQPTGATRLGENPNRGSEAYGPRNSDERVWKIIEAVQAVADGHGVSPAQVALAWLNQRPAMTSVILGARKREQLADNMAAADLALSVDDIKTLDEVSAPKQPGYPYGENGVNQRHRKIEGGR
ncbi:oxidoreductase [Devosia pacifica]|uniref:Oxidoreductase n=1 Tax=Devosia pacifica TaxID=1335967 RepID=A0A918SC90_9HYPH|nr:aldo/keto reductase [Devosia pacifica]GHA34486.1 oxidoreductase [Devosia pacifica]